MKGPRSSWGALAVCAVFLFAPGMAIASGLAYRDVGTGRWKGIAKNGDMRTGGAFATRSFVNSGFASSKAKAAIDAIPAGPCGGAPSVLAAFSGVVTGAAPNSGLFLYDATTDTILDIAVEGDATPIGGVWKPFAGIHPAIGIDSSTCLVHVAFRGLATGLGVTPNTDTGVFSATFGPLPSLAPVGPVGVIAQEGVTLAPPPFPSGSVFREFSPLLHLAAAGDTGAAGVHAAFPGWVSGPGVFGSNDTGVFMVTTNALGTTYTAAREGDVSCPPAWSGTTYANFANEIDLGIGDSYLLSGPQVVFRGVAVGGPSASNTAIVNVQPVAGCGSAAATYAIKGTATPLGGAFGTLANGTPLAASGGGGSALANVVFLAPITGGTAPRGLFYVGAPGFAATAGAAQGLPGMALGAGNVNLPMNMAKPSVNASGSVAFRASLPGAGAGLFYFHPTDATAPESLTGTYRNVKLDRLGNMTARFP